MSILRRIGSEWGRAGRSVAAVVVVLGSIATVAIGLAGCGKVFKLPTESPGRLVPGSHDYGIEATWGSMQGVRDILLTPAGQLFVLFNDGSGPIPRGSIKAFAKLYASKPEGPPALPGFPFRTLLSPVALCTDEDHIYVLDQGDTCLARSNPAGGGCSSPDWPNAITDLSKYWRVREYNVIGSGDGGLDTIGTFTDTTMAWVEGIAADSQGRIYISGTERVAVPNPDDDHIKTLTFFHRIHRYTPGPKPSGQPDGTMPGVGNLWHRDSLWSVEEGTGLGYLQDARGLHWRAAHGVSGLYASDAGNGRVQMMSDLAANSAYFQITVDGNGAPIADSRDVFADQAGNVYVDDLSNHQVLRYDHTGQFVQRVDIEKNAQGESLVRPITVAADSEIVFIGDEQLGKIMRYRRR